jgi:hypothetical protein
MYQVEVKFCSTADDDPVRYSAVYDVQADHEPEAIALAVRQLHSDVQADTPPEANNSNWLTRIPAVTGLNAKTVGYKRDATLRSVRRH